MLKPRTVKKIGTKADFTKEILEAVRIIAEPVKATLGPDGCPIILDRGKYSPLITKDGVTVAKSIFVSDVVKDLMIRAIKEASEKTNAEVGDGTTTAIVLVEALLNEGMKFIKSGLITPQALVREIKACIPSIKTNLTSMCKKVVSEQDIKYVANISANNDPEIASAVVEAVMRSGADGVTSIEEGTSTDIKVCPVDGFQIGKGWSTHKEYSIKLMQSATRQEFSYATPAVLCYNGDVTDVSEFSDFIIAFHEINVGAQVPKAALSAPIIIVAHMFSGAIRQFMVDNMIQNGIQIMLVETELWGTEHSRVYQINDLAEYTGGKVVTHGNLRTIISKKEDGTPCVDDSYLGCCEKAIQTKGNTTFYGGEKNEEKLQEYIEEVRATKDNAEHAWDMEIHQKRIARLLDGITVIECGGTTTLEIKERMDRVIDAVSATRAALKGGIVPGGGIALYDCAQTFEIGTSCGENVLARALQAPLRQIISNTGKPPDGIIENINSIDPLLGGGYVGYDALLHKISDDMFGDGIVDPLMVVEIAVMNALSIGCELLRGGGYVVIKSEAADPDDEMMGNPTE